jgi:hypothetical protein
MQYIENMVLDIELVDDGTLDTVVSVKNSLTGRATVLRYDAGAFDYYVDNVPAVIVQAKEDYLEQFCEFLSHHSNF